MFQTQADFVADGLHLLLVGAGADDEVVGERGDAGEVEDYEVGGFLASAARTAISQVGVAVWVAVVSLRSALVRTGS
jgi:hypothetical protein